MPAAIPGVILTTHVWSGNKGFVGRGSELGDEEQKDNDSEATEHTWGCFLSHATWSWKQWIWFPNILVLT